MHPKFDFIAIGAHADDLELGMGATLAKMAQEGLRGLCIDLTTANAASRGSAQERLEESLEAAQILGVERVNLQLPDAALSTHEDSAVQQLVQWIRQSQPQTLFAPIAQDYHPDHDATHRIARRAWYEAGLSALHPPHPRHRPDRLLFYAGALLPKEAPDFLVDVSEFWEIRQKSIKAYRSQFDLQGQKGPATAVSGPQFHADVEVRHRFWGSQARTVYAEAFWSDLPPVLHHPLQLTGKTYG